MRFVLVHGGFHGAWCWARTIAELRALGHDAIALDLPGHGRRAREVDRLAERTRTVVAAVEPGDVLVGHSGGGFDITIAANEVPDAVAHCVYLAAGLPEEGRTIPDAMTRHNADGSPDLAVASMMELLRPASGGRGLEFATVEGARRYLYDDCDEATVRFAFDHLTPEQFGDVTTTAISVPRFWAADLPRSYIRCARDHAKPRWLSDRVARRLGVEQLVIDSSHSPFLSRPAELAALLVRATATRPVGPLLPRTEETG